MTDHYQDFLKKKAITDLPTGFDPNDTLLPKQLFGFQRDIVKWACRRGRAALFEDCGMGKAVQLLSWSAQVVHHTGGMVLVLAPLGVAWQIIFEGEKFGIPCKQVGSQDECNAPGIYVSNYEKLHRFDLSEFKGLVIDESSILKAYDGKTRTELIERSQRVPYKLACTATPAPNDYMELGNHAEFLGVMSRTEMLATFFVHDGGDTSKWRLKGHAESEFWRWLCSWAVNIRKPSDLGYKDGKFKLPPLHLREHIVESSQKMDGFLFAMPASSLDERRDARRQSLSERVQAAAKLVNASPEQWVLWCNLNAESNALTEAVTGAVEVCGATEEAERERIIKGFLAGTIKCIVTKASIFGFGLNLQCCHNTALVGLSDSYEEFYQLLRRFWRFGQEHPVRAHIIISSLEGAVLANIKRKETDATRMADEMIAHMADISSAAIKGTKRNTIAYHPTQEMILPSWIHSSIN